MPPTLALALWMALMFVSVSVYSVVKSGSMVVTLLIATLIGLERPGLCLSGSAVAICAGIALTSAGGGGGNVSAEGMLLLLCALLCGSVRWVLTQVRPSARSLARWLAESAGCQCWRLCASRELAAPRQPPNTSLTYRLPASHSAARARSCHPPC